MVLMAKPGLILNNPEWGGSPFKQTTVVQDLTSSVQQQMGETSQCRMATTGKDMAKFLHHRFLFGKNSSRKILTRLLPPVQSIIRHLAAGYPSLQRMSA